MRYRLRTLLILLAIMPPLLAVGWWKYTAWKAEQERLKAIAAEQGRLKAMPAPRPFINMQASYRENRFGEVPGHGAPWWIDEQGKIQPGHKPNAP